jgi:quinol monooxygenase YgiN
MYLSPESADEFLEIFHRTKEAIRMVPGCTHLELLRDPDHQHFFATLSHWDNIQSLEAYRNTELFKNVWSRVKALFLKPAEAFSLEKFIEV